MQIVAFPCGQFMGQEHKDVCSIRGKADAYKISFMLTERVDVNGSQMHPLFQWLKANCGAFGLSNNKVSTIGWNFGKFLVNKDGSVEGYFGPKTNPFEMKPALEKALSQ
eukprot:Gregarina_sp_Poly_1__5166@NODE_2737_length_1769_cov_107_828437_g1732_i0_p1_GENE_NODE_2737_length_1769_cov_107_828437_g1732_i0NODE_2737_length_1769_cov_107_828437_g1732_i0_p1_ORF_typecomplete_len109_score12_72GSHPx/PF00255_19/1_2e12_NODE_2737_length_1769_cov_107_828437_g1732_i09151241